MVWLVHQVERLHDAFQHWRSSARQAAAAQRAVDQAEHDYRYAMQNVMDQQKRADEFRKDGSPKRADCALEELGKLQEKAKACEQAVDAAEGQLKQVVAIRDEIKRLLKKGLITAAMQVALVPNLSRAEEFEEEAAY